MTSQKYWQNRLDEIENLSDAETIKAIEKLYKNLYLKTERDLLTLISEFREDAWIDYYRYDRYYTLLNNLDKNIQELGLKEIKILDDTLPKFYNKVLETLPQRSNYSITTIEDAKVAAKEIWCVDGRNYSDRVWRNTDRLKKAIVDNIGACFTAGASTTQFKDELMRSFGVSWANANTLVKTEMHHLALTARLN